jgi:uncharacterized membrane protein YkvA (DUF1232 family)
MQLYQLKKINNIKKDNKQKIASYIKLIPKFIALFIALLRDQRIPSQDKIILGATVAYVLNPVDLIPDWIPFFGLVDDIYLVPLALLRLLTRTDEKILIEHWRGSENILHILKNCLSIAANFLPCRIKNALFRNISPQQKMEIN